MNAWTDASIANISTPFVENNLTSNVTSLGNTSLPILNYSDPLLSKILTSKKALHVLESNLVNSDSANSSKTLIELLIASCDGDLVTLESIIRSSDININQLFPSESNGVSCLIYSICFNNYSVAESLLNNHNADPDVFDTIAHYTPLMWAVYFNQLDIVKLLLDHQADPYLSPKDDDKNAVSLVTLENLEIYDFFKSHGLLKQKKSGDDEIYGTSSFQGEDFEDELSTDLRMQTLSSSIIDEPEEVREDDDDNEHVLSQDVVLQQLNEFDYDKLLPNQFLKFSDQDIPVLLDYIFGLRSKSSYQHNTKLPAIIIFQLVRYAHLKVESPELTEFLFDCFTARLRTVTNTKSGAFNMALQEPQDATSAAGGAGDIVLLSYWLSSIQFLHFYFTRNKLYQTLPKFLQEIINITQSLIATLSFSINSRLNLLVDDCLINFTNLVDVSNVLYAKDWNLFKKNKTHPSTYDDILDMLFPPSETELMKPSPLKYIQVLGALDYVLKIHQVDNLLQVQTFSQVFYYINATIFNRLISTSKYNSRAKAIQIRLNISAIEDWLRSHNMKVYRPESLGIDIGHELKNLLEVGKDKSKNDPHYLQFYYNSLYNVGKNQLTPTIELLQWLQCMSSLQDEDSLVNTINQFDYINYYQLFKVANKLYKYEVDEPKLPKKCTQLLKRLSNEQGPKQIERGVLHYMTQATFLSKELYIYLNPNFIFAVSLPNLTELINNYGAGLGGVKVFRSKKYQPSLPISIIDDIDEILTENKNQHLHDEYDYDREDDEEEDEDNDEEKKPGQDFKGDQIFKQVQMPNSLLHKNWGDEENNNDFEVNPW
ncbi:uncharacterized protein SPAPADRAFT_131201 [Spathaspora passalidarum NRRL Y-27907]|uniref:Dilute domain-containing protein n=1 Tax=Spathaspora passalidarum (strain NRRL Y-27907 / 11-Y1) TaxID=619300 RepID=G3AFS5_SPAPN|nr:uncharacterized protein SPAPADRAFT_131201 [Spathaspora passalidarum NRRL Y-27907]EGW35064.1 hypothetical protein SPAPADRAFT_131201 [Spathaspora passalidarum NRRL Y-27907]